MIHNSEKDYHHCGGTFGIQKDNKFFMDVYYLFRCALNLAKRVLARYNTDFYFSFVVDEFLKLGIWPHQVLKIWSI